MNRSTAWLEAVVEAPWYDGAVAPWPWPIATAAPFSFVRLHSKMTSEELGSVFAQFQDCSEVECGPDASLLLGRLAETACFGARGGFRVCRSDGVTITPGCCCGLENWRDWLQFLETGERPFLGHDPTPQVEKFEDSIRIWTLGDNENISFQKEDFNEALEKVHSDLQSFLRVAEVWAQAHGAPDPRSLIDKVDHCLAINYIQPLCSELG